MTPGTNDLVRFEGINLAGDRLFFETSESLTGGDTDDETDVYMSQGGSFTRISTGSGRQHEMRGQLPGSTPDGLHVFFQSEEVLTGDDDGRDDEFTCRTGYNDIGTPDIFGGAAARSPTSRRGAAASATSAPPARPTGSRPPRRTARASSSTRQSSPRTMASTSASTTSTRASAQR